MAVALPHRVYRWSVSEVCGTDEPDWRGNGDEPADPRSREDRRGETVHGPGGPIASNGGFVNASDKRKTLIGKLSCGRQRASIGERAEKGWNMPALKEISFEYARQIASVKGLQPSKVVGTSTLRFTKGGSEKLQVITWDEFERTANSRNL